MTANIKYQRPRPIKAQTGRTLVLSKNDEAQRAKEENAKRKAKSEYYFDQAPSIPNIVKGIYYWATSDPMVFGEDETPNTNKGVAPAVGTAAVRSVPQAVNWVKQSLPGLAFLSSWLGGRTEQSTPNAQTMSNPKSRLLDRAEAEAETESESPSSEESSATEESSAETPQSPEPEGKKPWRQRLADKIAGKSKPKDPKKPTESKEQTSFDKALSTVKKVLIETKNNNFSSGYQWRNTLIRLPLYYKFGPYAIGYGSEVIPEGFYHIGESFEEGRQAGRKSNMDKDTTQVTKQKPKQNKSDSTLQYTPPTPVTRYTQQQIDSINNLYDNYID